MPTTLTPALSPPPASFVMPAERARIKRDDAAAAAFTGGDGSGDRIGVGGGGGGGGSSTHGAFESIGLWACPSCAALNTDADRKCADCGNLRRGLHTQAESS
jgi:hypothetical protein